MRIGPATLGLLEIAAGPDRKRGQRYAEFLHRTPAAPARSTARPQPGADDLAIELDGTDTRAFGSRGEQRLLALALRLAEVRPQPKFFRPDAAAS